MRFIDEARVYVHAGKGGDGAVAFLREKYRPFGGPAGGDGGRGGDVIFEVNEGMSTLLDFKYQPRLIARDGAPGRGKDQNGRAGKDLVVKVPPGTMVFGEDNDGAMLADIVTPSQRAVIAHGGAAAAVICTSPPRPGARRGSRLPAAPASSDGRGSSQAGRRGRPDRTCPTPASQRCSPRLAPRAPK